MAHLPRSAVIAALIAWHLFAVLAVWPTAVDSPHARDYATYHYAAQVAQRGGDPYDRHALSRASRAEETRDGVYPYLYPPPFLFAVAWSPSLDLYTAYLTWFWLGELAALAAALALIGWLGPFGRETPLLVLAALAFCSAIPDNLLMGQANLLVLTLALLGLWQEDRGRWHVGGVLLGLAVVLKAAPVLLVAWWLLRGRFRAVAVAAATGLVATGLSVLAFGPEPLLTFLVDVVPSLRSGAMNGLGLPVSLFGNHSLANLWHQVFPSGGRLLSPTAQVANGLTGLTLIGALILAFRRRAPDAFTRAAQACAVMVLMLLLPVFTYEHHVVWALPGFVLVGLALATGRLSALWGVPLALAAVTWAWELSEVKALAADAPPAVAFLLREGKTFALLLLGAALVRLGRGP